MGMTKKTQPRKDAQENRRRLRTLTHQDLRDVSGGDGIPGNYGSSSGGGKIVDT
jgi:hypothetical protein